MYKLVAFVFCLWLWLPSGQAHAQTKPPKQVVLEIQVAAADRPVLRQYTYTALLPDSARALNEAQALVYKLQQDAYLLASVDSVFLRQDTLHAKLHLGHRYEWAALRNGNMSEGILVESGFREKFYRNIPFKPAEYVNLQQRILDYAERNGYPFASVWLDSI